MRRVTSLALVLVGLMLALPAGAFGATYGVVLDDGLTVSGGAGWDAARELNTSVVRVDVRWSEVAPTVPANPRLPGSRGYTWTALDARVRAASDPARPVAVILSVWGTPDWARQDGGRGGSPGDPAWFPKRSSWQNFIAALATRYSGAFSAGGSALPRVSTFEIWPNPNLQSGLRPQRLARRTAAPGLFRVLLSAASTEIRGVAAANGYGATIIAGGVARTDPASTIDTPPVAFLRSMARTRVAFDAVGLRLSPPNGLEGPTDAANLSITDIAAAVRIVDAYWPGQGRPLWLTGYGVPSGPNEAGLSDATQSSAVAAFLGAAADPRVAGAIWNALQDTAAAPYAGLRGVPAGPDVTGAIKPAWTTWTTLVPPPV